jgi:hypothetical protein
MPAKRRDEQPTKADKQALHTALNSKFGIPLGRIRQLIDDSDARITRTDIEIALRTYCRSLPKS